MIVDALFSFFSVGSGSGTRPDRGQHTEVPTRIKSTDATVSQTLLPSIPNNQTPSSPRKRKGKRKVSTIRRGLKVEESKGERESGRGEMEGGGEMLHGGNKVRDRGDGVGKVRRFGRKLPKASENEGFGTSDVSDPQPETPEQRTIVGPSSHPKAKGKRRLDPDLDVDRPVSPSTSPTTPIDLPSDIRSSDRPMTSKTVPNPTIERRTRRGPGGSFVGVLIETGIKKASKKPKRGSGGDVVSTEQVDVDVDAEGKRVGGVGADGDVGWRADGGDDRVEGVEGIEGGEKNGKVRRSSRRRRGVNEDRDGGRDRKASRARKSSGESKSAFASGRLNSKTSETDIMAMAMATPPPPPNPNANPTKPPRTKRKRTSTVSKTLPPDSDEGDPTPPSSSSMSFDLYSSSPYFKSPLAQAEPYVILLPSDSSSTPTNRKPKRQRLTKSPYFTPSPTALHPIQHGPHQFGLIQELVADDTWKLLVAVCLLNQTSGRAACPVFWKLIERWGHAEGLANADEAELASFLRPLGLHNIRARRLIRFSRQYIDSPPDPESLYRNKSSRDYVETPIGHYIGVGRYALDSYQIFIADGGSALPDPSVPTPPTEAPPEQRESDGDGDGDRSREPAWKFVLPFDKELRKYLVWRWEKEGFEWDWDRGVIGPLRSVEVTGSPA